MPARKRGATTRLIGSTAIISMPESCSVAFIRPISAVSAEPARPANSKAATTGPSSRTSDKATTCPAIPRRRNSTSVLYTLQAQHHTDEQARHQNDQQRQHADRMHLHDHQARARQQTRQAGQDLRQKQVAPSPQAVRKRPADGPPAVDCSQPIMPTAPILKRLCAF